MVTAATAQGLAGRVGWMVVLGVGGLLTLYNVFWFLAGPEMALESIAERTTLAPDAFREGSPSAFDVITIVIRQGAAFGAGMGLLAVVVGWQGYRRGAAWAWWASWAIVLSIAATGLGFVTSAGVAPQAFMYLGLAAIVAVALIAARSWVPRGATSLAAS